MTDRVVEAFAGTDVELVASNLSREQEQRLRQAFEADEPSTATQDT